MSLRIILFVAVALGLLSCDSGSENNNSGTAVEPGLVQDPASYSPDEKKAISFGLWGNNPKYIDGAIANARIAKEIYPEWTVVFYIDPSEMPNDKIEVLRSLGADVRLHRDYNNPFARFLIADDPQFERFIVRDCDSRLNLRERAAVEEWMKSGVMMHGMRDHFYHDFPVMAGMWGARRGFLKGKNMEALYRDGWHSLHEYTSDQHFLTWLVNTVVGQENFMSHDSYHCKRFANSIGFPTERDPTHFVGQRVLFDAEGQEIFEQDAKDNETMPLLCSRNPLRTP